jgi:hypothetical protein
MRLQVFKVVEIWIVVFWVVTPCSIVGGYQPFRRTYRLHFKKFYFYTKDGGDRFLRNVGNYLQDNTTHNPEEKILKACETLNV